MNRSRYWYRAPDDCGGMVDCVRGDFPLVADLRHAVFCKLSKYYPEGPESLGVGLANGAVLNPQDETAAVVTASYTISPGMPGAEQLTVLRVAVAKLHGLLFNRRVAPAVSTASHQAAELNGQSRDDSVVSPLPRRPGEQPQLRPSTATSRSAPQIANVSVTRFVLEVLLDSPPQRHRRRATSDMTDEASTLLSTASVAEMPASPDAALQYVTSLVKETAAQSLQVEVEQVVVVRLMYYDPSFGEMVLLVSGEPLVTAGSPSNRRIGPFRSRLPALCRLRGYVAPPQTEKMPTSVNSKPAAAAGDDQPLSDIHPSDEDVNSDEALAASLGDDDEHSASSKPAAPQTPFVQPTSSSNQQHSRAPLLVPSVPTDTHQSNNPRLITIHRESASKAVPASCTACQSRSAEVESLQNEICTLRQHMLESLTSARHDIERLRAEKASLDDELQRTVSALAAERKNVQDQVSKLETLSREMTRKEEIARKAGVAESQAIVSHWKQASDVYRTEAEEALKQLALSKTQIEELTHDVSQLSAELFREKRALTDAERRNDELLAELSAHRRNSVTALADSETRHKALQDELTRVKRKALALKRRCDESETRLAEAPDSTCVKSLEERNASLEDQIEVAHARLHDEQQRSASLAEQLREKELEKVGPRTPGCDVASNTEPLPPDAEALQNAKSAEVASIQAQEATARRLVEREAWTSVNSAACDAFVATVRTSAELAHAHSLTSPSMHPLAVVDSRLALAQQRVDTAAPTPNDSFVKPQKPHSGAVDESSFHLEDHTVPFEPHQSAVYQSKSGTAPPKMEPDATPAIIVTGAQPSAERSKPVDVSDGEEEDSSITEDSEDVPMHRGPIAKASPVPPIDAETPAKASPEARKPSNLAPLPSQHTGESEDDASSFESLEDDLDDLGQPAPIPGESPPQKSTPGAIQHRMDKAAVDRFLATETAHRQHLATVEDAARRGFSGMSALLLAQREDYHALVTAEQTDWETLVASLEQHRSRAAAAALSASGSPASSARRPVPPAVAQEVATSFTEAALKAGLSYHGDTRMVNGQLGGP